MQEFQQAFHQFYLHKIKNLNLTKTSSYSKVEAYTEGAIKRYKNRLYQSQKYFIMDLQAIIDFDAESAMIVFKEHNDLIRFQELKESQIFDNENPDDLNKSMLSYSMRSSRYIDKSGNPFKKQVLIQCVRCGKYTPKFKFCPDCEDTHYCSETCFVNYKLSHLKLECQKQLYPRIFNSVMLQIHFGSDLGHNIEVCFQHESRLSCLIRGKQIISRLFDYIKSEKQSSIRASKLDEGTLTSSQKLSPIKQKYLGKLAQKLIGYDFILYSQQNKQSSAPTSNLVRSHYLQIRAKNEKDQKSLSPKKDTFPSGKQKFENLEEIQRIYSNNPILQEIQLYFLREGGLHYEKIEEVHNNHVHYVYAFRFF